MIETIVDAYKSHGTFYRLIWTAIQIGAGVVAIKLGADPTIGALVTALVVVVTSEARKRLGG